jgi:hypothetical protein
LEPSTGMLRSVGVSRGADFHGRSRATATPKRGDTHTVPAGISCEARRGTIYAQRNHSILQSRPAGMAQWVASCHVTSIRVRLATLRRKRAAATRRHWHREYRRELRSHEGPTRHALPGGRIRSCLPGRCRTARALSASTHLSPTTDLTRRQAAGGRSL